MNKTEEQYLGILSDLLHGGSLKTGRNGDTLSRWCKTIRHDMRDGFPLLTTKQMFYKGIFAELLWVLNGRTDLEYLHDNGVKYWDLNYEQSGRTDGTLGPVYGHQMRNFNGEDQLKRVLYDLEHNPNSRRHLINLWNAADLKDMALPPCWYAVQFNVDGEFMDIMWNQRSADWLLGVPFDLAMMALFLELVAKPLKYTPRYVVGNFADTHLYTEHKEAAAEQISRVDLFQPLPTLSLSRGVSLHQESVLIPLLDDIKIEDYKHEPRIKAKLL